MRHLFMFDCGATTNTFYIPVPYSCRLAAAGFTANTDPGATNRSVSINKPSGSPILTATLSRTGGTVVLADLSGTAAYANQEMTASVPIEVVITTDNACKVGAWIDINEFDQKNA